MLQLQDAVDREGEVRVDLARQEREAGDAGDALTRASVALQISQCDARTQALALLTLHYCTALQYCTDDVQVLSFVLLYIRIEFCLFHNIKIYLI